MFQVRLDEAHRLRHPAARRPHPAGPPAAAALAFYPDCWDVLGGHVEAGETPEQALVREVQEEVAVTPVRHHLVATCRTRIRPGTARSRYHIFVVTGWTGGEPRMLGDEHSEIRWIPIDEAARLPDLAIEAYRDLLRSLGV